MDKAIDDRLLALDTILNDGRLKSKYELGSIERQITDLKTGHERGFIWDEDEAKRAVNFFKLLRHWQGGGWEWSNGPFSLVPWQEHLVVAPMFGWYREKLRKDGGLRRFRRAGISISRKNGKALEIGTPIPTINGWKTMGEIRVGDRVFDERGLPCNVVAITAFQKNRPSYEVQFADGSKLIADENHEWTTYCRQENSISVRTTTRIKETLTYSSRGDRNHAVWIAKSVQYPTKVLPISPYVLGVWLGDGTSETAALTLGRQDKDEVVRYFKQEEHTLRKTTYGGECLYRIGPFKKDVGLRKCLSNILRTNGLLKNKHIPKNYLTGSTVQRTALLQGLMDSDGTCSKAGQCEFTSCNKRLATDTLELIRSLGFKATIIEADAILNGRVVNKKYRITFFAYNDTPVFRLTRKKLRQKSRPTNKTRNSRNYIVGVKYVGLRTVKCIQVDSPSQNYLAGKGFTPTHNSTLCAGLALHGLIADQEPGARIYSVASAMKQAREVFDTAKKMIGPKLRGFNGLDLRAHSIVFNPLNGIFEPRCSDAAGLDGLNIHRAVIDELHAHPNRTVYDVVRNSTAARRNAMVIWISYAGYDRQSVWYEQQQYIENLLTKQHIDDSYFAYVARAEQEDDWQDPAIWKKGNPNYDVCINLDEFEDAYKQAVFSPLAEVDFKRSRLNLITDAAVHWMPMHLWDAGSTLDSDDSWVVKNYEEELIGRPCYAALDLSSTRDLTAWGLVFHMDDGKYKCLLRTFAPKEANSERTRYDKQGYEGWAAKGLIHLCDGDTINYRDVVAQMEADYAKFDIQSIAVDPHNASYFLQDLIEERGWNEELFEEFRQYPSFYNEPMNRFLELVKERKFDHGNDPVLRWCIGNLVATTNRDGYIKPDKSKCQDKIDGAVVMIMALALQMQGLKRTPIGTFYENNRVEFF